MKTLSSWDIIRRPRLTEKATRLREETARRKNTGDTFVFEVDPRANKVEIREAVEKVFDVQVLHVRTVNVAGKKRRYGRFLGERRSWKKAYVTLKPGGKTIDLLEG